jgi:hypothetical protein
MDGGCIDEEGSDYDYTDSDAGDESRVEGAPDIVQVDQPSEATQDTSIVTIPFTDEPPNASQNSGTIDAEVPLALLAPLTGEEQGITITPPVILESQQRLRTPQPLNLDRAERPGFWEEQDLDFGEEPQGSDTTLWGCNHYWNKIDAKQLSLCFWDRETVGKGKVKEDVEPECHRCWSVIKESGWECSSCAVVFCEECKMESRGNEAD